jgi:hypothetical protein
MESVLALQQIEVEDNNTDVEMLGSLASAGCDKPPVDQE